jgi:hypothetical protein
LIAALTRDIDRPAAQQSNKVVHGMPGDVQLPSQQQLLLVALIWVAAFWLPVVAIGMPDKRHALFTDWIGTISLALAFTSIVMSKNKS